MSTQHRSKQIPQGTMFYKPKIAFTYQPYQVKQLGINTSNVTLGSSRCLRNQNGTPHAKNQIYANNGFATPKRSVSKENVCPTGRPVSFTAITHCSGQTQQPRKVAKQSTFALNTSNSNRLVSNGSTPNLSKYPPLSPKQDSKTSKKCLPSNQIKKTSMFDQIAKDNQLVETVPSEQKDGLCKCGKPGTHRIKSNDEKCCARCGINKMMQGFELQPCNKPVSKNLVRGDLNETSRSVIVMKSESLNDQNIRTVDEFVKDVSQEMKNLKKIYKEVLENQGNNISAFYKQKKAQLRTHYEKIRQAIKQSVEEDIKQLQVLQKQQIDDWKKSIKNIQSDYLRLQQMQTQAKDTNEKLSLSNIKKQLVDEYHQIASRSKNELLSRGNKAYFGGDPDTMNISVNSNISNNLSSVSTTAFNKGININTDIYKSDTYRYISSASRGKLTRPTSLNVTSNTHENFTSPLLSPNNSIEHAENQNFMFGYQCKNHNNHLLFSFQGFK